MQYFINFMTPPPHPKCLFIAQPDDNRFISCLSNLINISIAFSLHSLCCEHRILAPSFGCLREGRKSVNISFQNKFIEQHRSYLIEHKIELAIVMFNILNSVSLPIDET